MKARRTRMNKPLSYEEQVFVLHAMVFAFSHSVPMEQRGEIQRTLEKYVDAGGEDIPARSAHLLLSLANLAGGSMQRSWH
jgi:hypothetical protein